MTTIKAITEQIKDTVFHDPDVVDNWRHSAQGRKAYEYFDILKAELFDNKLPQCVIDIDETGRLKKDGQYRWQRNGMAIPWVITLRRDLNDLELAIALVHNMVHLESEVYEEETNWYHSGKFIKRVKAFGIKTSSNGDTLALAPKFHAICAKLSLMPDGIKVYQPDNLKEDDYKQPTPMPTAEWPPPPKPKAKSKVKMIKFICRCDSPTIIRSATLEENQATCKYCESPWVKA